MTTQAEIIARVLQYAERAGVSQATASRRVFYNGARLRQLMTGESQMLPRTIARAMGRLDQLEASLGGEAA